MPRGASMSSELMEEMLLKMLESLNKEDEQKIEAAKDFRNRAAELEAEVEANKPQKLKYVEMIKAMQEMVGELKQTENALKTSQKVIETAISQEDALGGIEHLQNLNKTKRLEDADFQEARDLIGIKDPEPEDTESEEQTPVAAAG